MNTLRFYQQFSSLPDRHFRTFESLLISAGFIAAADAVSDSLIERLLDGRSVEPLGSLINSGYLEGDAECKSEILVGLIPSMHIRVATRFVEGSAAYSRHAETIRRALSDELRNRWAIWDLFEDRSDHKTA